MAALFFDLDGTLLDWHTNDWMPGAVEMLQKLKQEGHQIIFMTMRGHQDIDKLWSIENTLPILEKLGIEYRILFGVPSPRVMFDDSPTCGIHVNTKQWDNGAVEVNKIVHQVKKDPYKSVRDLMEAVQEGWRGVKPVGAPITPEDVER